jgi:DNA ligase-associated metallophosphoesterase
MLKGAFAFRFREEEMLLLAEKGIWFPSHQTLLVSDTHLAKGAHFRKSGIAVPTALAQQELSLLSDLIDQISPKKLIFLGDLFHSDINNDFSWFSLWREMHHRIEMVLIKGNHDILPIHFYHTLKIEVVDAMSLGPFKLMHQPPKETTLEYLLTGHIHPGIRINGKARQGITLPCFYFGEAFGILPAFGRFTGKALLKPKSTAKIFAVAGHKVVLI